MSQTVLVADDSRTIRRIVEMALKASTWNVVGASNASEAVQAAQQGPTVILLDYYMGPDGSGYDLCRRLKSDAATQSIPVVMLGGSFKAFDEDLARQSGADAVLMKPFNTDALLSTLENAFANGAAAVPAPPSHLPVPQPVFDDEPEPELGYGTSDASDAYGDSEGYGDDSGVYGDSQPSIEPEPVYGYADRREVPAVDPTPLPRPASQPRIPTDPPQARHGSAPDISTARGTATAGPAAAGMSRAEIENMIKEEVRASVRQELPGLLRTVMGEIFQQKVLPKLLEHAEQRVRAAVSENLSNQIRDQVRVELERLLEE